MLLHDLAHGFGQFITGGGYLDLIEKRIVDLNEYGLLDLLSGLLLSPVAARRRWNAMALADFGKANIRQTKIIGKFCQGRRPYEVIKLLACQTGIGDPLRGRKVGEGGGSVRHNGFRPRAKARICPNGRISGRSGNAVTATIQP